MGEIVTQAARFRYIAAWGRGLWENSFPGVETFSVLTWTASAR
jgi:hypothetical protein